MNSKTKNVIKKHRKRKLRIKRQNQNKYLLRISKKRQRKKYEIGNTSKNNI